MEREINKEIKLIPRMAVSYWDIKFQMQRQSDKIKKDYPNFFVKNQNRQPHKQ